MSSEAERPIRVTLPTDEELKAELRELIQVRIPEAYKEALEKLRLLAGIQKSDAVTVALSLFFRQLEESGIKKLR
ncbi:MAG: hypothetical protein PHV99_03720 [Candidatus Pacebacteria bacterium]|nr:hypothetical protein [Candidatus Paceibacterota bacterium]